MNAIGISPGDDTSLAQDGAAWSEAEFSERLADAVRQHDDNRSAALLRSFEQHLASRRKRYPPAAARADLKVLRSKRQFLLMRRYAEAVLPRCDDLQVRRQLGQALIELKELDAAIEVLTAVVAATTPPKNKDTRTEHFEARGLLGRAHKQKYIDSGRRTGAELTNAIKQYETAFVENSKLIWHGINAATCIVCAAFDGVGRRPIEEGREIAKKVLRAVARREKVAAVKQARLDVWDYATRVEALIDLGKYDDAAAALDDYLRHPGMNAFEISSTFRQFDEVMQLSKSEGGRPILDRVARAAERLRSGHIPAIDEAGTRAMLVRVADPSWSGEGIPDLNVETRMGTVIAVTGSANTVRALMKDPLVIAVEQSRPAGPMDCARSLPFIHVREKYSSPAGEYSESGSGVLVATIDNGIDVLHEAFLDAAGQSRIVGIWDQQDKGGPPPEGFTFGHYYGAEQIAAFVAKTTPVPPTLNRKSDGHGTHVASIAVGRKTKSGKFAGGVAPDAQLLVVISGGSEPIGYSHMHLAALKFIGREATRLNKPVVVNVSQGMNAGAHDGLSPLEIGFNNFAYDDGVALPGRAVVKSAGNERNKRGHAQFTVAAKSVVPVAWRCPKKCPQVDVELWWRGSNEYRFTLQSPAGDVSPPLDRDNPEVAEFFTDFNSYRMELVPNHPQNACNLVKIHHENGVGASTENDWTLKVAAVDIRDDKLVHAWVERSDYLVGFTTTNASEQMTLSIPGTSQSVITVGAVRAVDETESIEVGDFSSFGPTFDGREKPDVAAPGVGVFAAKRDTGDDVVEMDGTSMAAPHVTGAIALVYSKCLRTKKPLPTAVQLGKKLQSTTSNYTAKWVADQGFGVIDVEKLLAAF